MKNITKVLTFSSIVLLTACGGGGSDDNKDSNKPFTPTNAAAASNGATITPTTASNLIDGDVPTSWTSNDSPVVISFGAVKKIGSIKLTRINSSATLGTSPDILVELSDNGTTYTKSKMSLMFSGADCYSTTSNATSMSCTMKPARNISHIRISTPNSKFYDFLELEAITSDAL